MTLGIRRIIYIIFILAFLIITPLVALYATGYRINLSWPIKLDQTFLKTGMFILDSEPEGAKIILNNKYQQKFFNKLLLKDAQYIRTPAKIKNLRPGDYDVVLELAGYWNWQKKLTIKPGESTFAEDISLFKKDLPALVINTPACQIISSPDKKYLSVFNDNKMIIVDTNTDIIYEPELNLSEPSTQCKTVVWSKKGNNLLVNLKSSRDNMIILNLNNNKFTRLDDKLSPDAYNLKWDEHEESKIFYQETDTINYYDLDRNISSPLLEGQSYSDYLIKGDLTFLIAQVNQSSKLKVYSLMQKTIIKEIELPFSPDYKFINQEHMLVNLYDQEYKILYLIDPLSPLNPLVEIVNNINHALWVNNEKLLYYNDYEIWISEYDNTFFGIPNIKKTLLTRISKPINSALWHPSNNYIVYATDTAINIIELDKREKRNIIKIIKLDKISSLFLSAKGNILYFYAKIGNQEGLYKLAIQ